MDLRIENLFRPDILRIEGYRPEAFLKGIKLDANECPYTPSLMWGPKMVREWQLNRYPDPEAQALKKAVARFWNVRPENILQGNGSDELIYYLIAVTGGPVCYPVPTFSMYGIIARILGYRTIEIPLDERFDIPLELFRKAIREERPRIIFLSSPNNPTGNCFSEEKMLTIIKEANCIVVIDEAYQAYAENGDGFLRYIRDFPNLLVTRTFSKIGLAGIRLGFVFGHEDLLREINKARLPYNVNSLTQWIALQILRKKAFFKGIVKKIISERQRLMESLERIEGVTVYPSKANFILFKVRDAGSVHRGLLKRGFIIKNLNGLLPGCLRVTVGRPEENRAFLKALKEVL